MFEKFPRMIIKSLSILKLFADDKVIWRKLAYLWMEFKIIISIVPIVKHYEIKAYNINKKALFRKKTIKNIKDLEKIIDDLTDKYMVKVDSKELEKGDDTQDDKEKE